MLYIDVRVEYNEESDVYEPAAVYVARTNIPEVDVPLLEDAINNTDLYQTKVRDAMIHVLGDIEGGIVHL